jgi:hypothetical protein
MYKKFTLIFLFLLNINGNCQSYKPLLDNYNQWNLTTCNFGCLTDIYYTAGDTIVNSLNHKILDGYHYTSRTFLLRENVVLKKVYLTKINTNTISEYLLYDFSLAEGATFNMLNPISPFPLHGGQFVLDSIRMKPLVNGENFKHFYFSPTSSNAVSSNKVVWIEGIGSKSMINASGGEANINGVGHLSCFFKNQNLAYSNLDSISGCNLLTLKTKENDLEDLKLYSSQTKNIFLIQNNKKITNFELYDLFGKRLKKSKINSEQIIEFNLTNYPSGIYLLIVYDSNNKRKTFKIIVE